MESTSLDYLYKKSYEFIKKHAESLNIKDEEEVAYKSRLFCRFFIIDRLMMHQSLFSMNYMRSITHEIYGFDSTVQGNFLSLIEEMQASNEWFLEKSDYRLLIEDFIKSIGKIGGFMPEEEQELCSKYIDEKTADWKILTNKDYINKILSLDIKGLFPDERNTNGND